MFIRIFIVLATSIGTYLGVNVPSVPEAPVIQETAPPILDKAPLDPPPVAIPPTMVWPVPESEISSPFGDRPDLGYHYGIDFGGPYNLPIPAVVEGTVIFAQWNYGNEVRIQGIDGYTYIYGHLNRIDVVVGQYVAMGQQIGLMGSTGYSTGPHLHLEMWDGNGVPVDPYPILKDRTQTKYQ